MYYLFNYKIKFGTMIEMYIIQKFTTQDFLQSVVTL